MGFLPKVVERLSKAYDQWVQMVGVMPYDEILKIRESKRKH